METPYSIREIDSIINGVTTRFTEHLSEQDKTLMRIEAQTIKTNGSVAAIKQWKERITGGSIVVALVVIPLLTWALIQIVNIDQKVKIGVRESLSDYNVVVNTNEK